MGELYSKAKAAGVDLYETCSARYYDFYLGDRYFTDWFALDVDWEVVAKAALDVVDQAHAGLAPERVDYSRTY